MTDERTYKWYPNPNGPRAEYHRDVLAKAVGLTDEHADFSGKRWLIVGNEQDLQIDEMLRQRGARVTAIDMETVGDRSTRKAVLNSKELRDKYDGVLLAFSSGFYQGGDLQKLLRKTIKAADIKKGGTWAGVALDWERYDEAACTAADVRLTRLTELRNGLFKFIKFDAHAGKTLLYQAERAANRVGLRNNKVDIDETVDSRPKGKRIHEVEELVRMFITIIEKNVIPGIEKGAPKLLQGGLIKKLDLPQWHEYQTETAELMQQSEEAQPSITPPAAVTVRIRPPLKLVQEVA